MLDGVAIVLEFCSLGNQALTSFAATTLDQVAACFRRHAGAEAVLILASALGWLVGPFHLFGLQIEYKKGAIRRFD